MNVDVFILKDLSDTIYIPTRCIQMATQYYRVQLGTSYTNGHSCYEGIK